MSDQTIDNAAISRLFTESATTHSFKKDKPVSKETLERIYDIAKYPPTCFNCQPLRILYVQSEAGKEKLLNNLMGGNKKQTSEAPVSAILAYDTKFYEHLDKLCPAYDAKSVYINNESWQVPTASLNANIQAGYFMLAARALGVDVGPMTGANFQGIDEDFLKDTTYKSFLVVNLGYPNDTGAFYPRAPRFDAKEVIQYVYVILYII